MREWRDEFGLEKERVRETISGNGMGGADDGEEAATMCWPEVLG